MATEPAPCDLNVYLNARELRDVIFTPVFSTLFLPFSFVEDALGDNVILSAPSSLSLDDLPEATLYSLPPPPPFLPPSPPSSCHGGSSATIQRDNVFFGKQR